MKKVKEIPTIEQPVFLHVSHSPTIFVVSIPTQIIKGYVFLDEPIKQAMKTIFDQATQNEIIQRIDSLKENSTAQWGKMNVSQMIRHCAQWDEMALGKTTYKQSLLGKLFGKVALKSMLKDEPIKKNLPTVPSFVIKETGNFITEKNKWISLLHEYKDYSLDGFIHPFFGKMTKQDTGLIVYKHIDHHLKQFGA